MVRFIATVPITLSTSRRRCLRSYRLHLEIIGQLLDRELWAAPKESHIHEKQEDHADNVQVKVKDLELEEKIIRKITCLRN